MAFCKLFELGGGVRVRVALGVWVVSKKRVSAFKDGARGSSGQTCLSESALVLSLEVHPPDVLKPSNPKNYFYNT